MRSGECDLFRRDGADAEASRCRGPARTSGAKPSSTSRQRPRVLGALRGLPGRPARGMASVASESAATGDAALETARKVALRGILGDWSISAPSPDPGGRDQSLVRRNSTRHHDVRHWITSFPLLHLPQQMASPCARVKRFLRIACCATDQMPFALAGPDRVRRKNACSRSASVVARSMIVKPELRIASIRSPARARLGR